MFCAIFRFSRRLALSSKDGRVEGCVLIFCENTKIVTSCWQDNVVSHQKKKILCVQDQSRSPNKMVGGAQLHLKSNVMPAKYAWRAQTKPLCDQDPGKRPMTSTRDWARPAFEWVSPAEEWVSSGLFQGQGLWLQQSWETLHAGISPLGGDHH